MKREPQERSSAGGGSSKAARRSDSTPSNFKEMKSLPRDQQVGVWSEGVTVTATELTLKTGRGGVTVFSTEKLRAALPKDACLPVWASNLQDYRWTKCKCKGMPGHEFDGVCHQVTEAWDRQWHNPALAERIKFRNSFLARP